MALARDVADHLETVGQPDLRDLAQRRVRLLRGRGVDAGANAALLRRILQRRHRVARLDRSPRLADQLIDRRHRSPKPFMSFTRWTIPTRKTEERRVRSRGGWALFRSQRTTRDSARAVMHFV